MITGLATPLARVHPAPVAAATDRAGYELAVVVPTFNEAENVGRIVAALDAVLAGIRAEIIFVDDWSRDGTADRVSEIAANRPDVRVLRRWDRRGLASAVIEGMMATTAPVVAVIDGDGQHDETLLPRLYALVAEGAADVAIGSRYCSEGSTGDWNRARLMGSRAATRLSQWALGAAVDDPMSGFFAIRRKTVEALLPRLSGRGFKILFDLLSAAPEPLRTAELPYRFRTRVAGTSKLGASVVIDYLVMMADRVIRRALPSRLVLFGCVGTLGLGVHLAALKAGLAAGADFVHAEIAAVLTAILFNFIANNSFTFRDRQLRGRHFWLGLASFTGTCGLGALANIGIGVTLFSDHAGWWLSGIAGAAVGSLWNFVTSMAVTWRTR
jgi:dolichol-phosphate mannosyltransferase